MLAAVVLVFACFSPFQKRDGAAMAWKSFLFSQTHFDDSLLPFIFTRKAPGFFFMLCFHLKVLSAHEEERKFSAILDCQPTQRSS